MKITYAGTAGDMHVYEACVSLPRRVEYTELSAMVATLTKALREHRSDMQVESPVMVEAEDAPYAGAVGILLSVEGTSLIGPCYHLADSNEPHASLSEFPCLTCGRYYVDD